MAYSREVYLEASRELETRKLSAERELENRRKRLYLVCPRAGEIERELVHISVKAAKAVVSGSDIKKEMLQLKNKSLSLQQELNGILEKRGLSPDYLEPHYHCPLCRDTGNIDGKMCVCMKSLLRQTAYRYVNSESKLVLTDFDSFDSSCYPDIKKENSAKTIREYMMSVLSFCRKYAREFSQDSQSLIFQGPPGVGKTFLSLAIAKEVIDGGYGVIYVSAPKMLKRLENEYFGRSGNEGGASEALMSECDLLIIDDLGSEFVTKYSVAAVYNIINTRMLADMPTIISTNYTVTKMQEIYGERLLSRIMGVFDRVEFCGNDIRQIRKKRNNQGG